jgi:hypothetical protein
LKAVGVDAQVKSYPASVFFACPGPRCGGTAKLAQFAWVTTISSSFEEWECPSVYGEPPFLNEQRYCSRDLDRARYTFATSLGQEMVEAAAKAQYTIMQDIAVIPLVQRPHIEVISAKLQNHKLPNGVTTSFWNARQWYFR